MENYLRIGWLGGCTLWVQSKTVSCREYSPNRQLIFAEFELLISFDYIARAYCWQRGARSSAVTQSRRACCVCVCVMSAREAYGCARFVLTLRRFKPCANANSSSIKLSPTNCLKQLTERTHFWGTQTKRSYRQMCCVSVQFWIYGRNHAQLMQFH